MSESSSLPTPPSSLKPPLRWLITGGCGFIGLNLVKNLVEEGGHYIRIVDNLSVGTREDLSQVCNFTELDSKSLSPQPSVLSPDRPDSSLLTPHSSPSITVDLIVADILDAELAINVAKDIDIIVHLAANTGVPSSIEDPRYDCLNNVVGTLNYLEAACWNKVKRFVFASSGAPVGECKPPIHEEIVPHPVSPYGASKLAGEAYCSVYFCSFGIETVALRFGNVYGPLSTQKNSVVANFIKRALEGKSLKIYGDGKQTRDFIYIDDLVRAIRLSAIADKVGGELFQIASSKETTISELALKLIHILTDSGHNNIQLQHANPRTGDVRRNFSDISKAKKLLNWQGEISLERGLQKTVHWFIDKYT